MKEQEKNKKQKTKIVVDEKKLNENIKNMENEFVNKKKLPKEEKNKIIKKAFENLLIAGIIMLFLFIISIMSLNIETATFTTILKICSVILITGTILLFEYSYRKENGTICIYGIENFIVSVFVFVSPYLYYLFFRDFQIIIAIASSIVLIYYFVKTIIIYLKMKKKYLAEINDISEIIKK